MFSKVSMYNMYMHIPIGVFYPKFTTLYLKFSQGRRVGSVQTYYDGFW